MQRKISEAEILDKKRRSLKLWVIFLGVICIITVVAFGGIIVDKLLKGAPGGGLEINPVKLDRLTAWLGTEIRDIDATIAEELGLSSEDGVLINSVADDSPADLGGLERGDVILTVNGTTIEDTFQIQNLLLGLKPGDTVKLLVDKLDSGKKHIYVKLGVKPQDGTDSKNAAIKKVADTTTQDTVDPMLKTPWGIAVSPLTSDLREQFDIPFSEQGVVITAVVQNSLADSQGLEVGDIIESVNQTLTPNLQTLFKTLDEETGVLMDVYSPDDAKRFYVTLPDEGDAPPQVVLVDFSEEEPVPGKVAIASDRADIDGVVYYRFASSPYFIIYDVKTNELQVMQNPYAAQVRGMGITVAQMLINLKIDAVIVGGVGPQSFDAFYLAKVEVYGPATGTVRKAIADYQAGTLNELKEANLGGYGFSSGATIQTGGSPWTEEDDDAEDDDGGYEGQPETIPPKGKPGDTQLTAGGDPRVNRTDICVCPNCGAQVTHPASTSCSDMVCPICGSRLMTADPGSDDSGPSDMQQQDLSAAELPTTIRPIALQQVASNLWAITNLPQTIPPTTQTPTSQLPITKIPTTLTATSISILPSTSTQVSTCVCPVDGTTVVHPVGVPCAALQCPICGSRMVNGNNTILTGGQPDGVPPVQQAFYLVPVTSMPDGVPLLSQGGQQVAYIPVAGGPPADMGSSDTGGAAVDGPAMGGSQSSGGSAQSGRSTECICPMCKVIVTHPIGVPCAALSCPVCGSRLVNADPAGSAGGSPMMTTAGVLSGGSPMMTTAGVLSGGSPMRGSPMTTTAVILSGGSPMTTTAGVLSGGSPMTTTAGVLSGGSPMTTTAGVLSGGSPMMTTAGVLSGGSPMMTTAGVLSGGNPITATAVVLSGGQPDGVPPVQQAFYLIPVAGPTDSGADTGGAPMSGGPPMDGPSMGGGQAGSGAAQSGRSTDCICPMCETTVTHPIGVPCASLTCPVCGSFMINSDPAGSSGGAAAMAVSAVTVAQSQIIQVSATSKKIVVPSIGRTLKSDVAPLFDKAPYFLMFALGKMEVVRNPYYRDTRASGTEVAQFIVGEGGAVVLCNNISMSALKALKDLKVKVYSGFIGSVQQTLDIYADGRVKDTGTISGIVIEDDESEHEDGGGPPTGKGKSSKDKDDETNIF